MSKPNLLFISTDYQRGVDLPSFGSPFLIMPNVDRLCEEGVVFKNHISTNPICMPARACWMTGQYPHTHGLWDNVDMDWLHTTPTLMRKLKDLEQVRGSCSFKNNVRNYILEFLIFGWKS